MQMLCQFLLADRLTNIFAMNHSDDANDGLAHRVGYTFIFAMNHSYQQVYCVLNAVGYTFIFAMNHSR